MATPGFDNAIALALVANPLLSLLSESQRERSAAAVSLIDYAKGGQALVARETRACVWNLRHAPVECVVPTLIREAGASAKRIEAVTATNCMVLKGANAEHTGEPQLDRWQYDARATQPTTALFFDAAVLRQHRGDDETFGHELFKRMSEVMVKRLQAARGKLVDALEDQRSVSDFRLSAARSSLCLNQCQELVAQHGEISHRFL